MPDFFSYGNSGTWHLCSSRYAWEEARINLADDDQPSRLTKLSGSLHLFEAGPTSLPSGIFLPEKDVPILFAAIEARATHLLTGDVRLFHAYFGKKIQGIAVMRPGVSQDAGSVMRSMYRFISFCHFHRLRRTFGINLLPRTHPLKRASVLSLHSFSQTLSPPHTPRPRGESHPSPDRW